MTTRAGGVLDGNVDRDVSQLSGKENGETCSSNVDRDVSQLSGKENGETCFSKQPALLPETGAEALTAGAFALAQAIWYYQEPTTKQPAGPWTVPQLQKKWRSNQINGLTWVWKDGLEGGWKPLAEVTELKDALRVGADNTDEPAAKRQKRTPLDDVPITHTFTSEQGALYVYDTVDEDWKVSDVYESLLAEEAATDSVLESQEVFTTSDAPVKSKQIEEEALKELMEAARCINPMGMTVPKRVANAVAASTTAADLVAQVSSASSTAMPSTAIPTTGLSKAGGTEKGPDEPLSDPEKEAKRLKRRAYRERNKLKRQAGLFVKAKTNPNVYISGLPPDVTHDELETLFKKYGILKIDPGTGKTKVRIYLSADGATCKGDALITYANPASVQLANKFLNDHELRTNCRICVQQADFEDHDRDKQFSKTELQDLAASRKGQQEHTKKYLAAKNMQKEAVSWSGDMDDGTGRRIVLLKHMFSADEAQNEGEEFYEELSEEIREECTKIGNVIKVTPIEKHCMGIVCVKFRASSEAEECIRVMDGRYFGGRTVEASFYDGVSDLKALTVCRPKATASSAISVPSADAKTAEVAFPRPVPAHGAPDASEALPAGPGPGIAPSLQQPVISAVGPVQVGPQTQGPEIPPVKTADNDTRSEEPQAVGTNTWDWIDDQSSDSDDEFQIQTEA